MRKLGDWPGQASRAVAISVVLALSATVAACGDESGGGPDGGDDDFAVVQAAVAPFYKSWPDATKDAAKDFGPLKVEIGSPQEFDQVQQNSVVNSFVAKGANGVAIQPVDPVAGRETVKRLVGRGVDVVGVVGCDEIMEVAAVCINVGLQDSAYEATKLVCKEIGGKGSIVHVDGALADKNTALRIQGVKRALAENPDCKLLQRITDIESTQASQNAISALLSAKSKQIDGIIAGSTFTSVAVATELERTRNKQIKAVLVDDDPAELEAVKNGWAVATRVANAYEVGYLGVYSLKLARQRCTWKGERKFTVPYVTVTADKVATLDEDLKAAAKEAAKTWKTHWDCPS